MVRSQCETNLLPETAVPLVNAASFPLHALYLSVILLYLFV